jgi:hypothetical protein
MGRRGPVASWKRLAERVGAGLVKLVGQVEVRLVERDAAGMPAQDPAGGDFEQPPSSDPQGLACTGAIAVAGGLSLTLVCGLAGWCGERLLTITAT